ncbi:MAG: TlpA family protein disulfide reductase, partial [Bacteroidetes bacterium]|nr:TlpA family protein disulfide reductase [Bacteroidota bacterium]
AGKYEENADFAALGYGSYASMYAQVLYKKKDYAGALKYVQVAYDRSHKDNPEINETYSTVLSAMGRNQEALAIIEDMIRNGRSTPAMRDSLKVVYVRVKGSDAGYDAYLASLQSALVNRVKQDLAKQMISVAAPAFALKDMDGNLVSLASLKGKTVVVDFWATWCGPCKKSFPAMQMAVNRFKNNPDVVFLFVDTWETVPDPTIPVKEYISSNKYTFNVLFDSKPAEGRKFVSEKFNVSGIPTKFVIDKNGNIRFRFTGFSGDDTAAVEELATMIEYASKG